MEKGFVVFSCVHFLYHQTLDNTLIVNYFNDTFHFGYGERFAAFLGEEVNRSHPYLTGNVIVSIAGHLDDLAEFTQKFLVVVNDFNDN